MTENAAHARPAYGCGRRFAPWLAGLALVAAGCITAAGAADNSNQGEPFSKANHMLFMSDQLDNVRPPKELDYTYSASGTADDFTDHINLAVRPDDNGGRTVKVDFLSGKRHRYVPEITDAEGNPITEIFLQHDVWTLARQTGGSWRYFQKLIKTELQNNARISHSTARYHGHSVDVTRISISPYSDMTDHRDDMGKAVGKQYVFLLSNEVPGGVLEITSTIKGNNKIKDNVRKVIFDGTKPLSGSDQTSSNTQRTKT